MDKDRRAKKPGILFFGMAFMWIAAAMHGVEAILFLAGWFLVKTWELENR